MTTEVIQWASQALISLGYVLKKDLPEVIVKTPWSNILRFPTSKGDVILKQTPKSLALEANIIQILQNQFHASVPEIIAQNSKLNCFLMKDAGLSLRTILKHHFNESLLIKTIDQFTSLQVTVADQVDVFLNIGVPDWRLENFTNLYAGLLSQKNILTEESLSILEINKLKSLLPRVADLCKQLTHYAIKDTIVQPDFSDNNTLIIKQSKKITIIDLGELAISHPFFSLLNILKQMQKHYGLKEQDEQYARIKNACLKNFMDFESQSNLLQAFKIASLLFSIYSAFANYRLFMACSKNLTGEFKKHGRVGLPLKEFLLLNST